MLWYRPFLFTNYLGALGVRLLSFVMICWTALSIVRGSWIPSGLEAQKL
jgi:hypothetical protein